MTRRLTFLLTLLMTAAACGVSPLPTAPSPAPVKREVVLTVVTRVTGGTPLPSASVTVESHFVGQTDEQGRLVLHVPADREILVSAAAIGYAQMEAWGALSGPETWTFYLESQP